MSQTSAAPATGTHPATPGRRPNSTAIILFLSLGGLSYSVLQSLVAPALSTIGHDLNTSTADVSWILTAYLLSASVLTPIFGKLGDMVGKRRIMIIVLALLLVGTVMAALAPNLGVLIIARALQGAAGAVLPLSIGIVRDELPRERVSVTIGLLSAIFGIGAGVGIVAAGPIVQNLDWHWLFWLPAILIAVALVGTIVGVPESSVRTPGRIDLIGTVVLAIGLVAILLAISEGETWGWGSFNTVGLLVLGGIALIVFALVELRVNDPLIDVRLFKHRGVWTAHVVALIFGFVMFGSFVLIPTLLQLPTALGYGFGESVSSAGLFLLPTVAAMIVFAPLAGVLVKRIGPKPPMLLGGIFVTIAFILPAVAHDSLWQVVVSGILTGAGIGFALSAMSNAIIESVPATQTGEAISANTIARTIGSSIGTAVIAAIITANSTAHGIPTDNAFTVGFWVCAIVGVAAILAALAAPSMRKLRQDAASSGVDDLPDETAGVHLPHLGHGHDTPATS